MQKTVILSLTLCCGFALAKIDPAKAVNRQELDDLSVEARQLLKSGGMVASPTGYDQLHELYTAVRKAGQPMFITTDCILHSFHVLFDYSLRELESRYFHGGLQDLTQALLEHEQNALAEARDKPVKDALTGNVAYLSVAAVLVGLDIRVPAPVKKLVERELALIDAHQGSELSPIMGYKEDYSQYVPRGHYTRSERLQQYFRAMMWYGRIGFALKPGNDEKSIVLGRRLTRQAILLADALRAARVKDEPALEAWRRIYDITAFLVGRSDDLNADDYLRLADEMFGEQKHLGSLADDGQLGEFISRAMRLPSPLIVSQEIPDTLEPSRVTKGFRFMGQRYIPDSYMFQELVYTKVGTQAEPRTMPRGLDVMAVLGSERAREHLRDVYREDRFANYESQLQKLQEQFARLTPEEWNQNIYFGWLLALKLNNESMTRSKFLPEFCFQPAYADKCLVTASGSWAQLRHDTILYAKQSYTMMATAMPGRPESEPQPLVYVEPRPQVFQQIGELAERMRRNLEQQSVLSEEMRYRFEQLQRLAGLAAVIAEKQLTGAKPGAELVAEAWRFGDLMEKLAEFPADDPSFPGNDEDKTIETVADVHTDPNAGEVLEVAVGKPLELVVLVPINGKQYLARGGMFSYYEFTRPMSERMTDAQWQALAPKPPMPEWSGSLVAQ